MHIRTITIIGALFLLSGCADEAVTPFYPPNQYVSEKAFFPLIYKGENVFVGSEQVFVNAKSFAVDCSGTPLDILDSHLYLTDNFSAYLLDKETQGAKAEMSLSELFETPAPTKRTSMLIRDPRLIGVDGKFSNSAHSTSNQC